MRRLEVVLVEVPMVVLSWVTIGFPVVDIIVDWFYCRYCCYLIIFRWFLNYPVENCLFVNLILLHVWVVSFFVPVSSIGVNKALEDALWWFHSVMFPTVLVPSDNIIYVRCSSDVSQFLFKNIPNASRCVFFIFYWIALVRFVLYIDHPPYHETLVRFCFRYYATRQEAVETEKAYVRRGRWIRIMDCRCRWS